MRMASSPIRASVAPGLCPARPSRWRGGPWAAALPGTARGALQEIRSGRRGGADDRTARLDDETTMTVATLGAGSAP